MHVGILGAGTMGLTLATRLGQAGVRATVLEAAPQVGGLATWFDYGPFTWDKFYHVIPRQDAALLGLIGELGIGGRMQWRPTRTGFLWNNRFISMSNHWEFLKFPALNLWQKGRLAAGLIACRRWNDPAALEDMLAEEWLVRVFGRDVYRTIWEPLIESKYGALKGETPAIIMWATIRRYDSTRSRGSGGESLGFLSGGFKTLYDAFLRKIEAMGGEVRTSSPVKRVSSVGGRVMVEAGGETMAFDRVISTLPTAVLKKLAPNAEGLWDVPAASPRYLGVVCMSLVCRRPMTPFYVVNLIQKGLPFTGIIGVSALTGPEELAGRHLVMLPRYDVPESDWFERDAQSIASEFLEALRGIWPDIGERVESWHVHRERHVQALWTKPPPQAEPRRSRDAAVWSVNAELAGRDTLNNNAIVRTADACAEIFLRESAGGAARIPAGIRENADARVR